MRFCSLGSGSSGNSFVVQNEITTLLVDCGFGLNETVTRLSRYGVSPDKINAILLTHEHEDHIKGAFSFSNKYKVPIYLSYGTFKMCKKRINDNYDINFNIIESTQSFMINDIEVTPIPVPHDAREPFQFMFKSNLKSIAIITDLGFITNHIIKTIKEIKALVIEFNHDKTMLVDSDYPQSLKNRVAGLYGHLDNMESIKLLKSINYEGINWIAAAHLSEKNNDDTLVRRLISEATLKDSESIKVIDQMNGIDWLSV
ncbi:MBL fold metallo-hydrolase [Methylophilaceae bacterium]|nr:MBL fold metallo-hydrolase [Methylophilaceae bacterium]MDC1173232.1 MBL fold metallo-hydrolase [Methylophilaceae bacterium]